MSTFTLSHLSNDHLLRGLNALVTRERKATSAMLAHIAEVEARRLYAAHASSSMFDYCVRVLGFSEDVACRRTRVARAGREFPELLEAIAEGRLHLAGAFLIAPHLNAATVTELIAATSGRTKAEIERLVAERYPREDVVSRVRLLPNRVDRSPEPTAQAPLLESAADPSNGDDRRLEARATGDGETPAPSGLPAPPPADPRHAPAAPAAPRHRLVPIAPRRYALQATLAQETHDKLRYAQKLLSHQVPSGDVAQVLDRALDALIARLEKTRFGTTSRPRSRSDAAAPKPSGGKRYIPKAVRRAVHARDEGRCTFTDSQGRRCGSETFLEYDHVVPVSRGGTSSVENLRLRCRAHNQHAAELEFGMLFMASKRAGKKRAARGLDGHPGLSA